MVLRRFREIRRGFLLHHDPPTLTNEVLALVTEITRTDLGSIQLRNRRSGALEIVAQRGLNREFLDFFSEVRDEDAACGVAMFARQRVIVEDVDTHPIFVGRPAQRVLRGAGVQAVQSTPLVARSGELVGVISTHFRAPHRVPAHRLRLIDFVALEAAQLLQDSRPD